MAGTPAGEEESVEGSLAAPEMEPVETGSGCDIMTPVAAAVGVA